jgi:hypothetical protein
MCNYTVVTYFCYHLIIHLDGLRNMTKGVSQDDSLSLDQPTIK